MSRAQQLLQDERGGSALQTVILTPVLLILLSMVVGFGRVAQAHSAIDTAATEAARAASIERTAGAARSAADSAAVQTLSTKGLRCSPVVDTDTAGFGAEVGTPATVQSRVQCTVPLSDLIVPGLPGSVNVHSDATSPIDSYRERS